ncbi:hypothetical protein C3486_16830 [Streptomyces sp. Ru73]|nr:YDG/SRA domain-containing protein [Streptomyces sp. Ru73]POX39774.1 hypothetical protein C3486_16830 [Streptomyces sp. Ru73]
MANETFIGHVDGVVPGTVFGDREAVKAAKLHYQHQSGISINKDSDGAWVANAIVLNGGYEDDEDHWDWIRYTGAGARDERKKQIADQDWDYKDNAALKRSHERGHPIRIIRGHKGDKQYSPKEGYRYDGLYEITDIRMVPGKSGWQICQFDLYRLTDSQQELTKAEQDIAALFDFDAEEKFPETRTTTVQRIVRDTAVVRRVKEMYDHTCQVCGIRLVGAGARHTAKGRTSGRWGNGIGGLMWSRTSSAFAPTATCASTTVPSTSRTTGGLWTARPPRSRMPSFPNSPGIPGTTSASTTSGTTARGGTRSCPRPSALPATGQPRVAVPR